MTEKIVTGRFRANLALIFSVLALAISIVTFHQAGDQKGFQAEIRNLQGKLAEVKKEAADRFEKVKQEIGEAIKIEESG